MQLPELSGVVRCPYWACDPAFQQHGLSQSKRDLTGAVGEGEVEDCGRGCTAARDAIECCPPWVGCRLKHASDVEWRLQLRSEVEGIGVFLPPARGKKWSGVLRTGEDVGGGL